MPATFFDELLQQTPTRVWVNNPTLEEIGLALGQGAVGCTTNPGFGGNLLKRAPDEIRPIIADCISQSDDDAVVADLVQQRLVARIAERFMPVFETTHGTFGYVSIQGAPETDTDAHHILAEGRAGHELGPNVAPKIPATAAGLEAFEVLVADGCPTIVTEVFSLAQLIETCERYLAVTGRTGKRPRFIMSPISGIFGDHLKAIASKQGTDIPAREMELVGVALARSCNEVVKERGYPVTLLIGGARVPFDLTGLVGSEMCATINWSTFAQILTDPAPFARGIETPIDRATLDRLKSSFGDVARAFDPDGLALTEFHAFGPVQYFRNLFIDGWRAVGAAIAQERTAGGRLSQAAPSTT